VIVASNVLGIERQKLCTDEIRVQPHPLDVAHCFFVEPVAPHVGSKRARTVETSHLGQNLPTVAKQNLYLANLEGTETFMDAMMAFSVLENVVIRKILLGPEAYATDKLRGNIFQFVYGKQGSRVLNQGTGCGFVTTNQTVDSSVHQNNAI
jgi:hypothetical protein